MYHFAQALMFIAFVFLGQALATLSPLISQSGMMDKYPAHPQGIQRITRHPMNFAFVLFAIAHICVTPHLGDILFFGGFIVYGILSAVHQDGRTAATGPEAVKTYQSETSLLPLGAILTGRQKLAPKEYNVIALFFSIAAFFTVRYFHGQVFGGFGY